MKHGTHPSILSHSIMALVAFATVRISQAATIVTAPAGGDWSDPATWTGGVVPTSADRVEFANAPAVTVNVTTPQEAGAIYGSTTVGGTTNNYTLNVSSDLAVATSAPINLFNNVSFFLGTGTNSMTVNQTAGNVTVGNKLSIAPDGGTSVYNLNGGSLQFTSASVANREIAIGNNSASSNGGTGTLNLDNTAAVPNAGVVRLGSLSNANSNGNLLVADSASLTLTELIGNRGTITITGGTISSSGRMILGWTSGAANRASMNVNMSDGDVTFRSTSPFNFANYIGVDDGDAVFNISGGNLLLSNGVAGHLHIGANAGTSNGTLNISGGTVEVGTRVAMGTGYPGEVSGNVGDNGNGNGTLTISGTGRLVIGTGTGGDSDKGFLYLKSPNGGSGTADLNLDGGRIELTKFAIGSGGTSKTINFNGGTVVARASRSDFLDLSLAGNTTLNVKDGGAIFDTNGSDITVNGDLQNGGTGVGGVTKNGAGVLALSGANNTYGGPTAVNAGGLAIGGTYTGPFTFANGTKLVPRGGAIGTLTVPTLTLGTGMGFDFELGPGGIADLVNVTNAGGLTFNGGNFSLFSEGTALPFAANGTYTLFDYTTSFVGSLAGASVANPQAGKTYTFTNDPAATAIKLTIADSTVPTWNLPGGGSWNVAGNWTPSGVPNGAASIAKFGGSIASASTIDVAGAKTVGGMIFESARSYTISGGAADIITLDNNASSAAISVSSGSHTIAAPLILASDTSVATGAGSALLISGPISGTKKLTTTGAVTLTGDNTYTGDTQVNGGTLQIGNGGTAGSLPGDVVNNGTLIFNRSNTFTYAGTMTGTGSVTVASGTLAIGSETNIGSTGALTLDGGTLQTTGDVSLGSKTINVGPNPATINTDTATTLTSSGTINGTSTLTKSGEGTWSITGPTGFTGTLDIVGGTVTVPNGTGGAFGAIPTITVTNAVFDVAKTDLFGNAAGSTQDITLNAGGVLTNGTSTFAGFNSFKNITLNGGEMRVTGTSNVLVGAGGARFQAYEIKGVVSVGGTVPSSITNPNDLPNAAINIGDAFDAAQVIFDVADVTSTPAADLTVTATLRNSELPGFGAPINTGLQKTGPGTMVLAATNAYTGLTSISEGRLVVNGSIAGSATSVDGGTVSGSGSLGTVNVNSGGKLAPGESIGTMATGPLTLSAASTLELEINTSTRTTDLIITDGDLVLDKDFGPALLTITDLGSNAVLAANTTLTFINYTGTWNGGLFRVGGALIPDDGTFQLGGNVFRLDYNAGGNSVALISVPEPNAISMMTVAIGCLGLRRRYRRAAAICT